MSDKVKLLNEYCIHCGKQITTWDKRLGKALGYKNTTCENCIAKEYDVTVEELRATAERYFGLIPCFGA